MIYKHSLQNFAGEINAHFQLFGNEKKSNKFVLYNVVWYGWVTISPTWSMEIMNRMILMFSSSSLNPILAKSWGDPSHRMASAERKRQVWSQKTRPRSTQLGCSDTIWMSSIAPTRALYVCPKRSKKMSLTIHPVDFTNVTLVILMTLMTFMTMMKGF